jgi:hypothetical protein
MELPDPYTRKAIKLHHCRDVDLLASEQRLEQHEMMTEGCSRAFHRALSFYGTKVTSIWIRNARGSDLFGREWSVLGIQFHFPDSRELRGEVQRAEQIEDHAERSDHQSTPLAVASRPFFTALVNNS